MSLERRSVHFILELELSHSVYMYTSKFTNPVSLYISYVSFLYFLGGPGAVGGAWGRTSGVLRLKMLLKSNKALCLPVHQSRYEKQLKKQKFA